MPQPPSIISDLVERFDRERARYKSTGYKEAELRQEFINPFWEALGWDMTNRGGLAEAYKEVIHEDSLVIGGQTKAPDYVFRVGRERKFFLEAKAPKVDLKMDVGPAYQLKRYAWSAGLPVSILSDFEEFAVYQCTAVPKPKDPAAKDRIEYLKYTDYLDKWDFIHSTFSRDAIWQGAFDKFAAAQKGKRGTTPFDKQFLADMLTWRDALAKNIALRNREITERELNFAVQVTLDRIIMLRICEDRGIEQYGNLATDAGLMKVIGQDKDQKVQGVYQQLIKRFRIADDRFNSGLFHFSKEKDRPQFDDLTPRLTIDDKVLTTIIGQLYYPESPYAFDYVPSDILGHVYEQFLGQVITLTPGHNARIEEKPEVKKAGGVYYTPTYIVDYIVKNTVGKLLGPLSSAPSVSTVIPVSAGTPAPTRSRFHTFKDLQTLTILDPACGSGSFLLGAYQYLLDWYLKYYLDNEPAKWVKSKALVEVPTKDRAIKDYVLSPAERKRILLTHIHGVDIDSQAVEVAKLNLMLKVLEGTDSTKGEQRITFDKSERLLPDLDKNILCGNSLIGWDYFNQGDLKLAASDEVAKINPMDWKDVFPSIMKRGGFDAVLGNPPYGATLAEQVALYFRSKFATSSSFMDTYILFIENSARLLNKGGMTGIIVQNGWVTAPSGDALRIFFARAFNPIAFVTLPYDVFGAYVDTIISVYQKKEPETSWGESVDLVTFPQAFKISTQQDFQKYEKRADPRRWLDTEDLQFLITTSDAEFAIMEHIKASSQLLQNIADVQRGVTPFFPSPSPPAINPQPAFTGTIRRYSFTEGDVGYIRYDESLAEYKPARYFKGPRILLRQIISRQAQLQACCVETDFVTNQSMQSVLITKPNYDRYFVLGVMNSRLMSWLFLAANSTGRRDDFPKIVLKQTRNLPIPRIDFSSAASKGCHDRIANAARSLQSLISGKAKGAQTLAFLDRQIAATDREIDRLVYELYGLTEEEIRVVEGEIK